MSRDTFIVLGKIIKPHGVKGGLRIEYYADDEGLLEKPLLLRAGNMAPRPIKVRDYRLWQDELVLFIEGCGDRSAAERMRGQELLIDESFLPEAEEDEPYINDLLGLQVELASGQIVGILEDIEDGAGQELWTIRTPESEGAYEVLLPAVPEFVLSIDLESEKIIINPPEGLLELNRTVDQEKPDDGFPED